MNENKSNSQFPKTNRIPYWLRQIILFLFDIGLFRIGAIVVAILIIADIGVLFTTKAVVLVIYLVVFVILWYLKIQITKDEEGH